MLFFDFYNLEDSLTLYLWLGPPISTEMREQLLKLAEQNAPPFRQCVKQGQYHYCYRLNFLTESDYATCSDADLKALIETKWQQFMTQDLPLILGVLRSAEWFWKAPDQLIQPSGES